jgi:cell division protein FtsN
MEQQKILWVIFSVTLFFLVVVVVGFVWFLPSETRTTDDPQVVSETTESAAILDPIVWVRDDGEAPGLTDEPETQAEETADGDLLLVYGEADAPTTATGVAAGATAERSQGADSDIEVIETRSVARLRSNAPTSAAVDTSDIRPSQTAARAPSPAVAKPIPAPQPKTVRTTQYWIQAGSYRSQSRAEETRTNLSKKGWDGRIVTRDVSGDLFYRVRLGPYETEAEAEKFLEWIRDIDSFESSYVSQVYSSRTVN